MRIKLFLTYVRPLLDYNTTTWSPHLLSDILKVESVQRKFTRRLCRRCNIKFLIYKDRIEKLNLESLEVRRIKQDLIFLYKILHNYVDIDFDKYFQINHFSCFRLRRYQFQIKRQNIAKTAVRNSFFTYRVTRYWNELPENVANSPTLETFRYRLRRLNLKVTNTPT